MTFADLLAFLRGRGMDRLAFLFEKYQDGPEVGELKTMLPALGRKLAEKGHWSPPVAVAPVPVATADLSPLEESVLPLLRELDAALASGGPEAAMQTFHAQIKDVQNRNAYLAVLAA